jgi:ubiquinone/menaquinone biosynthesis C-methylase UbiE
MSDPQVVREQYRTPKNLDARIQLHQRFSANPNGWLRWAFDQFDLPPGARVLEVGCGTGRLWAENHDRVPHDWRLVLSDRSVGMVQQARAATDVLPQVRAVAVADVGQLPFADATFDAAIANHMLYHVPDIPAALHELWRVLRLEGRIFTATNGAGHLRELIDLVAAFDSTLPFARQTGERYALENASALLSADYRAIEVLHYDDALHVTDAQALVDYVLSAASVQALPNARQAALAAFIRDHFMASGSTLTITKRAGMVRGLKS